MKVTLGKRSRKRWHCDSRQGFGNRSVPWKKAAPFVVNPRAYLIHRVRFAATHFHDGHYPPHDTAEFWCGNQSTSGGLEFVEDPPKDRLLCAYCEAKAIAKGEPSADELTGRHVHLGVLKPKRTCCSDERN